THAFSGESFGDLVLAINIDPIPLPSRIHPELHGDVDAFFARALERDPSMRFQSAAEMADAFSRLGAEVGPSPRIHETILERSVDEDAGRAQVDHDAPTVAAVEEDVVAWVEWDKDEGVATVLLKPGSVGGTAESIDVWKHQVSAGLQRFGCK